MKTSYLRFLLPAFLVSVLQLNAATLYVNGNSTTPVAPYSNWSTAAITIQDAVDAATSGDTILVTNGIYGSGGRVGEGTITNRVAVTKPLFIASIKGPAVTIIAGYQIAGVTNGDAAVRCVYLTNGAVLSGFTLTNGATGGSTALDPKRDQNGGGVYCASGAVVSNCVLAGNSAFFWGGGAAYGTLNNSTIIGNSAFDGGGVYFASANNCVISSNVASRFGGGARRGTLNNCTLVGNSAPTGGGMYGDTDGVLNNCIVYYNTGSGAASNHDGVLSANYCCTAPLPSGVGNITNVPLFVNEATGNFRLQTNSPCINAGNNAYAANRTDVEGFPRIVAGVVDIGAYEFQGPIRFVSLASTNPISPYSDWSVAATNIQDAIDAASASDTILVSNGVYAAGGRVIYGSLTNRVAVTKPVSVQSVGGPSVTLIQGRQAAGTTNGDDAVRCVYLTNGAALSGFTISGGATRRLGNTDREQSGGGVWCESTSVSVSNCVLIGNASAYAGAGAVSATLTSCILSSNAVLGGRGWGGGAWKAVLRRCSLFGNSGFEGGGAFDSDLSNCLLKNNFASYGGAAFDCRLETSTLVGNSASYSGGGVAGGTAETFGYNCVIYYNSAPSGSNFSGGTFANCCTAPLPAGPGNISAAPSFVDMPGGDFRLRADSPCMNAGDNAHATNGPDLAGNLRIVNGVVDIGAYEFQGAIRYVSQASTNPISPYSDWAHAATKIQDAIDVAVPGDTVLVTNGIYATGGRIVFGSLTNRVAITKAIQVQSVNGPEATVIRGYRVPGGFLGAGDGAVRCVYLTNGALLNGFTLTNGATRNSGDQFREQAGGGVWCDTNGTALVVNCVIRSNSAACYGAGAYGGTLERCKVDANIAYTGGGAYRATLENCLLTTNYALNYGGGAYLCSLTNCTLVGNRTADGTGGGAFGGSLNNCIAYFNTGGLSGSNYYQGLLSYCCTRPAPTNGVGNITNAPSFVEQAGGNFRLQSNSPCINAGRNEYVASGTDLDGRPRIVAGTVDVGAYEFQGPGAGEYIGWLERFRLARDGSADFADPDLDGMNNWQEWSAGTVPTNSGSILRVVQLSRDPSGLTIEWQSVSNRTYFVERGTNLAQHPPFVLLLANIAGSPGTTTFTDTNAFGPGPFFYRMGVQGPPFFAQTTFSLISFAWLQQYGLPTDGSADDADADSDGFNNWQEWRCGTSPIDATSGLRLLSITNGASGVGIAWASEPGHTYRIERATNLAPPSPFVALQTNVSSSSATANFVDTSATGPGPYFYRVALEP